MPILTIADIDVRLPIILQDGTWNEWLDPKTNVENAQEFLKHHRGGEGDEV